MSKIEPHRGPGRDAAQRHIPQVVVPIAPEHAADFLRDALKGTSLVDPFAQLASGWVFFEPHVRFTAVDATHTRIELDVTGRMRGVETLLFVRRRGEIDRFFVAIQDELDRRERWRPHPGGDAVDGGGHASIEGGD
ncbi:hypothetical protein [Leifsonia sp. NCR5]|uniref:hypothetical protein n=1 Tax=Leifsonia sp. NCR5 TaxID=1978342 RepID=UPI000A19721D|nr:hypothetical protein [Leifsonia sp. NCR5]